MSTRYFLLYILLIAALFSCDRDDKLFTKRTASQTGIDFRNTIHTTDTFNALSFEYIYNGAGVGIGDFDNDGLKDLFLGGNQVSSRMYLNKGEMKFVDITNEAGVATGRWITGVSVVDINGDGLDDVYLSVGGETSAENRRNLLFVNQGVTDGMPVFKEFANDYGLDSQAYSTMAAFFDYDKDGDLDMYLLNNWLETFNRNNLRPRRVNGEAESTDQLFRNNGNNTFDDVSREAGILIEGYGLGVAICDINEDSWPDVYVANDFMSSDLLWINQRDGTFRNDIGEYLKHQTHNGMGVDIADFNNDALADIVVVDMLPPGHVRQKMMTPGQNYDHFHLSIKLGHQPQYMRNTLQLNRGKMPDGTILFSEIAFLAGVSATDWSWAPLFADFDNDGFKDLFIANGYRKDVTNLDFVFFGMEENPFSASENRETVWREKFKSVPDVRLSNYIFRNNGSLVFQDKTREWGLDLETFSNGAAYADLDNDGDLDLITNNIDEEIVIFENNLNKSKTRHHFIRLTSSDRHVSNEKIHVYTQGRQQFIERTPYRGFQSTVENFAHFGLGEFNRVDSIVIEWPDEMALKLFDVPADTVIIFSRTQARRKKNTDGKHEAFEFAKGTLANFRHVGSDASDIKSTRTLMHELSRYGPCLAKGDVNGDGLDDFYVGVESPQPGMIFIQQLNGNFEPRALDKGPEYADGAALFFDADNDGDNDLYIGSAAPTAMTQPQPHTLYLNDGNGHFTLATGAIPQIATSASCVEAADIDGDGDLDLFVGGRIKPTAYPHSPQSFILKNEGGKFTDITESVNPSLAEPGMISSAAWVDYNNDKRVDLVITGEWQPVRIFRNDGREFTEITGEAGLADTNGWWNCIRAADLNHDGYADLVVGNTGRNSFFQPGKDRPVQIVAKDFDNNGSMDPIITYFNHIEKQRFIVHNRLVLIDQIPGMKRRFETFTQYASRPFDKVFSAEELAGAHIASAYKLESVVLINQEGKSFTIQDLPDIAQLSTINDILVDDVNEDGAADIIAIGNMYGQETLFGRYNASIGTILLGDGNLSWTEFPATKSGLVADGDARYIESLTSRNGRTYVITNYNDSLRFFIRREKSLNTAAGL